MKCLYVLLVRVNLPFAGNKYIFYFCVRIRKNMDMKLHNFLYLFILTSWLTACHTDSHTTYLLQQADSLLNVQPDSAQTLLRVWEDSMANQPEDIQMYYQLLCIKANDKNYIAHTSDSLILPIVAYYTKQRNKTHLPEALYYAGRVYSDLNDAPRALEYYQQAIDVMKHEKLIDYNLSSRIYSQMGTLFVYQELYNEAPEMFRKAYWYDSLLKDSTGLVFDLRDIGRVFASIDQRDSAVYYFNRAGEMALRIKDSTLLSMVYNELAGNYIDWNEYSKGYEKLQIAQQKIETLSMPVYYNNIADYYYYTNQLDSAIYYYKKNLSIHHSYVHKASAYESLAQIASKQNNFTQALNYYEQYMLYEDSLQQTIRTATIDKIHALYNYQQYKKENIVLKRQTFKQKQLLFVTIFSLLFLLLIGIVFWQKQKRKEQTILLQQEKLKRLQEEIKATQVVRETSQKDLQQTEIWKKLHQPMGKNEAIKMTDTDWLELTKTVEETYPNFVQRLNELCPLSQKELQVCLLIKINVSLTQIADIVYSSKQGISSLRQRLYKKFTGKKGKPKDCDNFIQNL